ncbi:hypothetical protein ACFQH6_18335 [Halobacteriaceae archaeon GCM10025711]
MDDATRANYALLDVLEHLGDDEDALDVPWATFAGNRTSRLTFEVPSSDVTDAYFGLQAFDVGAYGHEVLVNDEPVTGFDIPPRDGWQYWVDSVTGTALVEGENSFRVVRDAATEDNFVVGVVTVHWKEPTE